MSISVWIIVGIIVAIVIWAIVSYNRLIVMRQQYDQAFADVNVLLRRRHDLDPSLIETVRGYASHERRTFTSVAQARNAGVVAGGPADRHRPKSLLSRALGHLFALTEPYPNLKANTNFQQLQADLTGFENRLAAAHRFHNSMV